MEKLLLSTILLSLLIIPMGVEAKKKSKKEEIPQLSNYPSAELSEYRLHGGNVVVQGHIVFPEEAKGGYLQEKFQFTGIPFVVIYDKDGNRREDKTVQQLLEEMK